MLNDFPPQIMVNGKLPGDGFVDAALRYLVERMPEYEHRFEVASMTRFLGLLEQGQPVCHPASAISPERQKIAELSVPVHVGLHHRVTLRKDRLPRFMPYLDREGRIDVQRLLADDSLTVSVTDRRVYSTVIDQALAEARGRRHVQVSAIKFDAALNQVAAGWIDYTFIYPIEASWYKSTGRIPAATELAYLPIAGNPDLALGVVACTKGAWGRKIVTRVNELVRAAGARPPWIDVEIALSDAESARHFEAVFARDNPFRY